MAKVAGAVGGGALLGNMFMRRDDEVELDGLDDVETRGCAEPAAKTDGDGRAGPERR